MKRTCVLSFLFLLLPLQAPYYAAQKDSKALHEKDSKDYYRKWLNEDVVYIITSDEKSIFQKLATVEERDAFIEQFWQRRDPDPRTPINEVKEEHYRRIAYANENFKSGIAGWKTDRGRIYIIHGPPSGKEAYPTGGTYEREANEGGGSTSVYPFERWWYRDIDGMGADVTLEFVDFSFSNEYALAVSPEQKDAFLNQPGLGATWAEEFMGKDRKTRPYYVSNYGEEYPGIDTRARDSAFRRYETYFKVQAPAKIKYKDLQEVVKVNINYDALPFHARADYIRLNDDQVLAPVTLQFENKDLTFKELQNSTSINLAVYGVITTLTNRVVQEFEDEISGTYKANELERGKLESSTYQKIVPLNVKMRYKLELVVKDLNSGKIGTSIQGLAPPLFPSGKLVLTPPILSGFIRQLNDIPKDNPMFVLGDIWIRPNVTGLFLSNDPLGVYFQVYNAVLDQTNLVPSIKVTFQILKDGRRVRTVVDTKGESLQYSSSQRLVVVKALSLQNLESGRYKLEIKVEDVVGSQAASVSADFRVEPPHSQVAKAQ